MAVGLFPNAANPLKSNSISISAGRLNLSTLYSPKFGLDKIYQYSHFEPNDWKPMPTVGPGVQEIRIHTGIEHRVFYVAKFAEGVYVLHAFEKRTRKTPKREPELARDRFRALVMK